METKFHAANCEIYIELNGKGIICLIYLFTWTRMVGHYTRRHTSMCIVQLLDCCVLARTLPYSHRRVCEDVSRHPLPQSSASEKEEKRLSRPSIPVCFDEVPWLAPDVLYVLCIYTAAQRARIE